MTRLTRQMFIDVPILGAVVLAAVAFAVGYVLRYVVIEPDIRGIMCNETVDPPLWCGPRQWLIVIVQTNAGRWLTVGLAAAAWTGTGRWVRWGSVAALAAGLALTIHYAASAPAAPLSPSAASAHTGWAAVIGSGPLLLALAVPIAVTSWLGGGYLHLARWFALAAMATGGLGTVLYNAGPGVVSLALAGLRLIGFERLPGDSR